MKRVNIGVKFFVLLVGLCAYMSLSAQPPQKMSYQAVVRNANNELVVNQQVQIRMSIIQHSINGPVVFMENHTATTNFNGLVTVEIGAGQSILALTLNQLDWANDDFFIKMEVDPTGGNQFLLVGVQQLLTVPYAFHSNTTSHFDYNDLSNRPAGNNTGDILYWNATDSSWHIVPAGSSGQVLTMTENGVPQWHTTLFNQDSPPIIVTDSVYNITGYTLQVHSTIANPGSTGIISSGVCWSSSNPYPSIGNNHTTDGSSVGSFISNVAGLQSNTTYYVRAYATNSIGTGYGNVIVIISPTHCGTVTDYDGNVYQTVYIGRQCWFKENLRTKTYADGGPLARAVNTAQSPSGLNTHSTNNSSCYYYCDNDTSLFQERGLLYTWNAVMKGAGSSDNNPSGILGICPYGWHVPSSTEWCELENALNPGIDVNCSNTGWRGTMAKMLSKPTLWTATTLNSFTPGYWSSDSTGFNTTDFSLIPAGYVYYTSYGGAYYNTSSQSGYTHTCVYNNNSYHTHYYYPFNEKNTYAYFWTSSQGKYRRMAYDETGIYYGTGQTLTNAYSVRCVKDY